MCSISASQLGWVVWHFGRRDFEAQVETVWAEISEEERVQVNQVRLPAPHVNFTERQTSTSADTDALHMLATGCNICVVERSDVLSMPTHLSVRR